MIIAVTASNNIYALNATSGAVIWQRNLGTPPREAVHAVIFFRSEPSGRPLLISVPDHFASMQ